MVTTETTTKRSSDPSTSTTDASLQSPEATWIISEFLYSDVGWGLLDTMKELSRIILSAHQHASHGASAPLPDDIFRQLEDAIAENLRAPAEFLSALKRPENKCASE